MHQQLAARASLDCLCRAKTLSPVLCPSCVRNSLQGLLEQRRIALEERNRARETCADCLRQLQQEPSLSELAYESQTLREELGRLRHDCGSLAVQVAAQVVKNEERRSNAPEDRLDSRVKLHKLQESLVQSAMPLALQEAQTVIRIRRFQLAIQAFEMHKLQVGEEESDSFRHRHARGIGKLGGLPLPHAGPELYGVLPPQELSSALRLVASLTLIVSQCLGIVLPHPILLQRGKSKVAGDIIETCAVRPSDSDSDSTHGDPSPNTLMSSITSLWTKKHSANTPTLIMDDHMPLDRHAVAERLQHAQYAVLSENESPSSCNYVLTTANANTPEAFAIGLQLLQNDVVALCIRAGVSIEDLWPAEVLLLNLHALWKFCLKQAKGIV